MNGNLGIQILERALGRGGIVAYHDVRESSLLESTHITPHAFDAQLEFLTASYHVIPLAEFVQRRVQGQSVRHCVSVTFDDAYAGVLTQGLPILERRQVPATVFVATSYCEGDGRFWWDRYEWIAQQIDPAAKGDLTRTIGLDGSATDDRVRDTILVDHGGRLPPALHGALQTWERRLGQVPERAMNVDEIVRFSRSQLVEFGCHTMHHYALPWLTSDEIQREVREAQQWLEQRLPRVRRFLAYPYGLHSPAAVDAVRESGMDAAFTISGLAATSAFPMYQCPRIGMADVNTLKGLRLRLAWASIPLLKARDREWMRKRTPRTTRSRA